MHQRFNGSSTKGPEGLRRIGSAFLFGLILAAAVTGCSKAEFVPDITLAPARPIIDATAEFHDLHPAPALLSGKENFGLAGPDAKAVPPRVLANQVQEELLDAFEQAGVFSKITPFDRQPDLILTGRINALHEHYRPRVWTKLPLPYFGKMAAGMLDLKTHSSSGEADLTLFLLTTSGELIGTYRGSSSFDENFNPTGEMAPGARLNRALADAVQKIQDQMLHDSRLRTIASR